jgi:hypothetical protein
MHVDGEKEGRTALHETSGVTMVRKNIGQLNDYQFFFTRKTLCLLE